MSSSSWAGLSDHAKGLVITSLGVLILTPDALLLRLIEAPPITVLFWRGLGFVLVLGLVSLARHGGATLRVLKAAGLVGFTIALLHASSQFLFVYSINHTKAANTLVIIAAAPLAAALMARLLLDERTPRRTLVAGIVALLAVGLTVQGGIATGGLLGDRAALGVMLVIALVFVLLRKAKGQDMLPALGASGIFTASTAWLLAPGITLGGADLVFLPLLVFVVVPVSFLLICTGPRYLPAPEVGLLLLLETILGPLWVWLVLAETPSGTSLVGGAIIIATLAINAWLALAGERRAQARALAA